MRPRGEGEEEEGGRALRPLPSSPGTPSPFRAARFETETTLSPSSAATHQPPGEESCTGICCLSSCLPLMSNRAYKLVRLSLIPFQLVVILAAMCKRIFSEDSV